ncbi:hypothetical protein DL546_001674 [Coniochaeta pulveracea]|uniref:Uncharacterized protein n=1 Tax=Coniochaeta pulveracea TaxID=177199 RepID=A0A420Y226_9PEZI|nr:hypothetical protein DL546_001674 [Coniochaeta pulveracea]
MAQSLQTQSLEVVPLLAYIAFFMGESYAWPRCMTVAQKSLTAASWFFHDAFGILWGSDRSDLALSVVILAGLENPRFTCAINPNLVWTSLHCQCLAAGIRGPTLYRIADGSSELGAEGGLHVGSHAGSHSRIGLDPDAPERRYRSRSFVAYILNSGNAEGGNSCRAPSAETFHTAYGSWVISFDAYVESY